MQNIFNVYFLKETNLKMESNNASFHSGALERKKTKLGDNFPPT